MRDKKRIHKILQKLEKVWKAYPELRLCQLIQNCYGTGSIYYIEDEELIRTIERVYKDAQM